MSKSGIEHLIIKVYYHGFWFVCYNYV